MLDVHGGCHGRRVTSGGTATWSYNSADRLTTSGTVYDNLARTTTLPAADTANPSGGNVTIDYHVTDLVKSISQGSRTTSYTLDVIANRIRSWTDNATGSTVTKRHHYANDGDSPVWTAEDGSGTYTRPILGLSGYLGTSSASPTLWHLINLHGDAIATLIEGEEVISATHEHTETGTPRNPADLGTRRYGWLATAQRATDAPAGITLMGVRLYNPAVGRFHQADPVHGGNANPYEYCAGDGANCSDTTGLIRRTRHWWGTKILFNKYETDAIAYWLHEWPLGSWPVLGGLFAAVTWAAKRIVASLIVAAFGPYIVVIAAAAAGWLFWVGSTASYAKGRGRCLQVVYNWGAGVLGGIPQTYSDGCR